MKSRKREIALATAGVMLGTALAAPATTAALTAQQSSQKIFVDGRQVQIEAYSIGGSNYCKLRDVGEVVGFEVGYDPLTNTVHLSTDKSAMPPAVGSRQLSQTVFSGGYTANVYDALREAMCSGSATITASAEERDALRNVTAAIGSYPAYDAKSIGGGKVTICAKYPAAYAEAAEIGRQFIGSLAGQSAGGKATAIANYVCDRLVYEASAITTPRALFTADGIRRGNCMSYAHGFQFLCELADIPCVLVHSEAHQWNEVYIDGKWHCVDLTSYDIGYTEHGSARLLADASELQGRIRAERPGAHPLRKGTPRPRQYG